LIQQQLLQQRPWQVRLAQQVCLVLVAAATRRLLQQRQQQQLLQQLAGLACQVTCLCLVSSQVHKQLQPTP
jgi:uncharacterized membrane protein (UPF0136 family)